MTMTPFGVREMRLLPLNGGNHTQRPHLQAIDRALHTLYPVLQDKRMGCMDTLGEWRSDWTGILAVHMVGAFAFPSQRASIIRIAGGLSLAAWITKEELEQRHICLFAPAMKFHYAEHRYADGWRAQTCNHRHEGNFPPLEVLKQAA